MGYNVCMSLALSSSLSWFIVSSVGFYQDQSDRESDSSSVITARRHSGDEQIKFQSAPGQSASPAGAPGDGEGDGGGGGGGVGGAKD